MCYFLYYQFIILYTCFLLTIYVVFVVKIRFSTMSRLLVRVLYCLFELLFVCIILMALL